MWYKILIENEYADYFINNESFLITESNEKTARMLGGYADIVSGVTYAWTYREGEKSDRLALAVKDMGADISRAFDFCCEHLHLTQTKALSDIWNSIPRENNESCYSVDVDYLNEEQCAVLIMYPFFSRMGSSFEKNFQESGDLKKYLLVLKSKCMMG